MRVSIVVPYHNAAPYLARCVSSVIAQSYRSIELLLIDDASSDGGRAIAERFAVADPRVRSLSSVEQGANPARKAGVRAARGECVMFLDADDELEADCVDKLVDAARRSGADVACGNICSYFGTEAKVLYSYPGSSTAIALRVDPKALLLLPPSACAKLFRRALLDDLPFENVPFAQDWNITYGAMARASTLVFIQDVVYRYIRRSDSTSATTRPMSVALIDRAIDGWSSVVAEYHERKLAGVFRGSLNTLGVRFCVELLLRSYTLRPSRERQAAFRAIRRGYLSYGEPPSIRRTVGWKDKIRAFVVINSTSCFALFELTRIFYLGAKRLTRARASG